VIPTGLLKTFAGVSIDTFDFEDEDDLNAFLEEVISMASSMIEDYCNYTFDDNPPAAVKNVCLRLSANIIAQAVARQDIDLLRAGEYSNKLLDSRVFTDDLKEDLRPYINITIQFDPTYNES